MLRFAAIFFVIAIVAALFGFGGIAAGAAAIAQVLFFVFLALFLVSLLLALFRRKARTSDGYSSAGGGDKALLRSSPPAFFLPLTASAAPGRIDRRCAKLPARITEALAAARASPYEIAVSASQDAIGMSVAVFVAIDDADTP